MTTSDMFLAAEFDAVDEAGPYVSAARRRETRPELLSRIIGYLETAPEVAPGLRTDGVWVWPQTLATHARHGGAMPQDQFLQHVQQAWFLLPDTVPETALIRAAAVSAGPVIPDPTGPASTYFASAAGHLLLRVGVDERGVEEEWCLARDGWERSWFRQQERARGASASAFEPVSGRDAARLADDAWATYHDRYVAAERETEPVDGLRVARVFDGETPDGLPWFSPRRLRIPEPDRRARLAAYLSSGALVLHSTSRLVDPLGPGGDPLVPLGFRTDGVWVWQEALAYYVRTRGLAPESELLCHIEERGYRSPAEVPADLALRAAAAARGGVRPAPRREEMTYFYSDDYLLLVRAPGGDIGAAELLSRDLRWSATDLLERLATETLLQEVSAQEAARIIDEIVAADELLPPSWRTPG